MMCSITVLLISWALCMPCNMALSFTVSLASSLLVLSWWLILWCSSCSRLTLHLVAFCQCLSLQQWSWMFFSISSPCTVSTFSGSVFLLFLSFSTSCSSFSFFCQFFYFCLLGFVSGFGFLLVSRWFFSLCYFPLFPLMSFWFCWFVLWVFGFLCLHLSLPLSSPLQYWLVVLQVYRSHSFSIFWCSRWRFFPLRCVFCLFGDSVLLACVSPSPISSLS